MIFSRLIGGLGNQMFQFATAYSLAKYNNTSIGINIDEFNPKNSNFYTERKFELNQTFNITNYKLVNPKSYNYIKSNSFLNRIKNNLKDGGFITEYGMHFQPEIFIKKRNIQLEGYFQSEKYFLKIENEIREQFTFKQELNKTSEEFKIKIQNSNSLAVHIRRGDYVSNEHINSVHGICDIEYYKKSIKKISTLDTEYFFFSDDQDWVKRNFLFLESSKCHFIDCNKDDDSWQDMKLMSLCQNFIIANSSFSWWGAWLSKRKNKTIIAPKKWFSDKTRNNQSYDLIPDSWIRI